MIMVGWLVGDDDDDDDDDDADDDADDEFRRESQVRLLFLPCVLMALLDFHDVAMMTPTTTTTMTTTTTTTSMTIRRMTW